MSRRTKIVDGNKETIVEDGGYLRVQNSFLPPNDVRDLQTIYREFLTIDGDGTTVDLRVDGSTTSQFAFIQAIPDFDIYIREISFLVADVGLSLQDFGAINALTNGCRLYYEDNNGEINIGTSLTSNFEIIRLCGANPAFFGGTNPFIIDNFRQVAGQDPEGIIPVLDFGDRFGFNPGLRLAANTTHKLVFEINDNVSTIDVLEIIATGFKIKRDRS